ncbi:olfactory receptor 1019-like, partial [Xenopus tropicalis]|uniref:Olfactory receptor 1019-like n=1 Tax=Xenopus tropicalis TaxID=8364 RepID=A0A8J1JUW2_XENTR
SLIDISFSSNILPNLLHILLTQQNNISFLGCMTQMYLFVSLTASENFLLTAMAYDRYVAICDPLHYIARMSRKHCAGLITAAFTVGFVDPVGHVVLISKLSYCASHLINHFFCDVTPLLKLSCSSTFSVELFIYIEGTLLPFNSFLLTLTSYIFIISAILKIQSSEGRQKAFSTCASHLACVITLYGTIFCLYMRPTTSYSLKRDKYFSLLYIVLGPVLAEDHEATSQICAHAAQEVDTALVSLINLFNANCNPSANGGSGSPQTFPPPCRDDKQLVRPPERIRDLQIML